MIEIHRVRSVDEPAYQSLLRIYLGSQPENELKSPDQLARMIERPEYYFLVALRDHAVVAYSISICLLDSHAAFLEYIAVARELRGSGLGGQLFRETTTFGPIADRILLIEVDSDKSPCEDHSDRVRRKNFYRRLGCREIERLSYIMPPVSSAPPPPMDLLVYQVHLPGVLGKTSIRGWLESCYSQMYGLPQNDSRIERMLNGLPDDVRLI